MATQCRRLVTLTVILQRLIISSQNVVSHNYTNLGLQSWMGILNNLLRMKTKKQTLTQKKFRQSKFDFEVFCKKIGWTTTEGDVERKKRWFGASEFTYDVKKAPEGHLPLTSALRGTSLIKELLAHPVWDNDDWKKDP